MKLLVDTSVWSEALRRKGKTLNSEETYLYHIITNEDDIFVTGIILQEILTGIKDQKIFSEIEDQFRYFNFLSPTEKDHIEAAKLRNLLSKKGIVLATIDALIAQIAITHNLILATYDNDFLRLSGITKLKTLNFEDYKKSKRKRNVD
ncbi:PIN domain nuclease [Leptospira gomenensis]|uniref:Ribonuclease VapC n=1 Tax=Leptospira gomenensis TaxID=2484974 RepID=A0A5F1YF83_9LEPT|nr:PIN domain-containing protein [Leptospira gomenensis]TGK38481.1 PIN domain nuclease [Leptospira gomenensis]TGK42596.1 PIN domain nuclease [Leptospira gomenensis]TGK55844.1 PIN domain nuclease [Leptospira gomenensis]